jgi:hypothetical protein
MTTKTQAQKIFAEIRRNDYCLEDRREYCVEDLQLAYELNETEAQELFALIQAVFAPRGRRV